MGDAGIVRHDQGGRQTRAGAILRKAKIAEKGYWGGPAQWHYNTKEFYTWACSCAALAAATLHVGLLLRSVRRSYARRASPTAGRIASAASAPRRSRKGAPASFRYPVGRAACVGQILVCARRHHGETKLSGSRSGDLMSSRRPAPARILKAPKSAAFGNLMGPQAAPPPRSRYRHYGVFAD